MNTNESRKLLKRYGFSKIERIKFMGTGQVYDIIKGPLQEGGFGRIKMQPADQTNAGLRKALLNGGFILPAELDEREELFEAIRESEPKRRKQYAERNGWSEDGSYFVVQTRVIGKAPKGQCGLFPETIPASHRLAVAGTLKAWKAQVAGPAAHSSAMLTAIAAALAAPLLKLVGSPSFAYCLSGPSKSGKTVATIVAASVIGWPGDQPLWTWDMTDAGMDDLLIATNDLIAPIDDGMSVKGSDTGRIKRLDELSYKLASGRGRARHHHYEREHGASGTWRTIALTSNEKALSELSRTYDRPQGATVRMIDVPVILRGKHIFDGLDEVKPDQSGVTLKQLAEACSTQHGSALVALVQHLIADPVAVRAEVDRHVNAFKAEVADPFDADLTRDLARKFGLLFAAARIASSAGVVDWSEERIAEAVSRTYRAAREQLADEGKLVRDGCAILLREMRSLPKTTQLKRSGMADEARGYRYQTPTHHHCWLRNEAFDKLFASRSQRELVEGWLQQRGRLETTPSRKGALGGDTVKRQHHWMGDANQRVRSIHINWPRLRRSHSSH